MAAKGLSPDETKALINDKTVEAVGARGYESVTYFAPDGTFRHKKKGKKVKGDWHVDSEGN